MNISFSRDEKIAFLEKKGYFLTKGKKIVEISQPSNFTEWVEIDTIFIYKDKTQYMPHLFDSSRPFQWLDMVFEEELKKAILDL